MGGTGRPGDYIAFIPLGLALKILALEFRVDGLFGIEHIELHTRLQFV
jgi:hypothetical protein